MRSPDIRFVRRPDDASIAYQVFGDGPELLCLPGFVSNLEYQWQFELTATFFRHLGSFARVAELDQRGCGLSERLSPSELPPLEVLVEDAIAVQDAAGFTRSTVFGWSGGASTGALLAAMYPERVERLILFAAAACGTAQPDYPWQFGPQEWQAYLADLTARWGTTEYFVDHVRGWLPSVAASDRLTRQLTSYFRVAANARAAVTIERMLSELDIRDVLPLIRVPTLVLHRIGDVAEPIGQARYIASQIPGAELIELPGEDGLPWAGNQDDVLGPMEEFLTGSRADVFSDGVLAAVMFTDIVDSTRTALRLGDRRWSDLLADYHHRAAQVIADHQGTLVDTAGDGILARFDGPARSVRCALDVRDAMIPIGIAVRGGCHTGEIQVDGDAIRGVAVHIGARVAAAAAPHEVWVSSTVRDLTAGSGLHFDDVGEHELKGVPDQWRLYRATD